MTNASSIKIDIEVNDNASAKVRKFGSALSDVEKSGSASARALGSAWGAFGATIGAVSLVALGREIISIADNYTNLESRLKLVTGPLRN